VVAQLEGFDDVLDDAELQANRDGQVLAE